MRGESVQHPDSKKDELQSCREHLEVNSSTDRSEQMLQKQGMQSVRTNDATSKICKILFILLWFNNAQMEKQTDYFQKHKIILTVNLQVNSRDFKSKVSAKTKCWHTNLNVDSTHFEELTVLFPSDLSFNALLCDLQIPRHNFCVIYVRVKYFVKYLLAQISWFTFHIQVEIMQWSIRRQISASLY